MADLQVTGGIRKLNQTNYNTWSTCMMSYLQGQDLWEVVNGTDTVLPRNDVNGAIGKWRVKTGKEFYVLKTTIEEELLEHIRDLQTPKQAWDALVALFSKKNDAKLQLLERMNCCPEIGELDPEARIGEPRMKRIIIHGLKPEYRMFVAAIQGWPTQPSLVEFENLLAGQESLAKQMAVTSIGGSTKAEDTTLYADRGKGKFRSNKWSGQKNYGERAKKQEWRKSNQNQEKESNDWGFDKRNKKPWKQFPFNCHKCGQRGHMAKYYRTPSNEEGSVAVTQEEVAWDVEAHCATVETVLALNATTEEKNKGKVEWIVDSGCSNHMTGMKKNLLSVPQITASGRYLWVYFMKEKSEAFTKFKEFKYESERDVKYSIQCLRSDNGGEYTSREFNDYLKDLKIKIQLTCSNTP
ncbi:uncharacterized protein LOC143582943 [Bidens hawaiensis]|uniref:uncharacterized protein LOC143582943 n=1 Tax=Bidens hawaiensis TaxID=980011 RepID=UPI00404A0E47